MTFVAHRRGRCQRTQLYHAGRGRFDILRQPLDDRFGPAGGRILVIDVAVDALPQSRGAELLEAPVDALPGLAIFLIGRIAEREHRVMDSIEPGRAGAFDELEE